MKKLFLLSLTLMLAGCAASEKIIYKRIYVKTPIAKAPAECDMDYKDLTPIQPNADLNVMTKEVAKQRKGRLQERAKSKACQAYAKKVSGKR